MSLFATHWRAAAAAMRRLAEAPLHTLFAALGVGVVLALPATGHVLLQQLSSLGGAVAATPQMTLFMDVAASRDDALSIAHRLQQLPESARVDLTPREETLKRMRTDNSIADVLGALPENPFPDAIIITMRTPQAEQMEKLAAQARQWPGVAEVLVDSDLARRLAALQGFGDDLVRLLAALFACGLVAVTFILVRMQLVARRVEIELCFLLGADNDFIARPFLWHGALLGLLGGAAAWLIVVIAMHWLAAPLSALPQLFGLLDSPPPLLAADGPLLMAAATLLAWLGTLLSLHRNLP